MNSLCSGNCEECRFRKVVPGTEERIDREPAYYCSLFESKPSAVPVEADYYQSAYNEGFTDGYDNAIERVIEMLKNCTPNSGAYKQPGENPEKEGN